MKRNMTVRTGLVLAALLALTGSLMACGKAKDPTKSVDTAVSSIKEYVSEDGWKVRYDEEKTAANKIDDHSASFVYLGESAGTNMVTIS